MRSTIRDRTKLVTFSGTLMDAASGTMMSYGDISIPMSFVRNSTGNYGVNFDPRIVPVAFIGAQGQSAGNMLTVANHILGVGNVTFIVGATGNVATNGNIRFTITALDTRL